MKFAKSLVLVPLMALGGCAASSYCEGEQDYQQAVSIPAVQTAEGLHLPESGAALRIPPPPAKAVPYGETVTDEQGDEVVRCLDKPPAMPPPAEPKVTEPVPAPEAAPAKPADAKPAG